MAIDSSSSVVLELGQQLRQPRNHDITSPILASRRKRSGGCVWGGRTVRHGFDRNEATAQPGFCQKRCNLQQLWRTGRNITASMVLTERKRRRSTRPNPTLGVEAPGGHRRNNTRPIARTAACDWATKAAPRGPGSLRKEDHQCHLGCTCCIPTASTKSIAPGLANP